MLPDFISSFHPKLLQFVTNQFQCYDSSKSVSFEKAERVCHQFLCAVMVQNEVSCFLVYLDIIRLRFGEPIVQCVRLFATELAAAER